jgi:Sec-independent protein translocase protein TatA
MNYILFLSDVSGSEILLVLVFVLVFFGAKSIPTLAKTLGKLMYQIKNASSEIQQEIKKAGVDIKGDMDLSSFVNESVQEVATPIESSFNEMNQLVNEPIGSKPYVPIAQNEPHVLEVENESNSIGQVDLSEVSKGNTSSISKE